MRWAQAIRTMPALWLAVPVVLAAAWYATLLPSQDGYSVAATAQGTATLAFIGSFCAIAASWEGSRLRRASLWRGPWVRRSATIVFWCVAPAVIVGLIAVLAGVAVSLARSGGGVPDGRFLIVAALGLVAFGAIGFTLGVSLPFEIAGPLAIVGPLFWLTFTPAIDPVWLRHLTGMFRDCCLPSEDLATAPIVASSVVDVGLLIAAVIALTGAARRRRIAGVIAITSVAGALGVNLVAGMGFAPTAPRSPAQLACAESGELTVCIWPEHRAILGQLVEVIDAARPRWLAAGIVSPAMFTEAAPSVAPRGAAILSVPGEPVENGELVAVVARSLLPAFPDCPSGATGWMTAEYVEAWFEHVAGMPDAELARLHSQPFDPAFPPVLDIVHSVGMSPPAAQQAWLSRVLRITQACDPWPIDDLNIGS